MPSHIPVLTRFIIFKILRSETGMWEITRKCNSFIEKGLVGWQSKCELTVPLWCKKA